MHRKTTEVQKRESPLEPLLDRMEGELLSTGLLCTKKLCPSGCSSHWMLGGIWSPSLAHTRLARLRKYRCQHSMKNIIKRRKVTDAFFTNIYILFKVNINLWELHTFRYFYIRYICPVTVVHVFATVPYLHIRQMSTLQLKNPRYSSYKQFKIPKRTDIFFPDLPNLSVNSGIPVEDFRTSQPTSSRFEYKIVQMCF